jgi:hypothetical protein
LQRVRKVFLFPRIGLNVETTVGSWSILNTIHLNKKLAIQGLRYVGFSLLFEARVVRSCVNLPYWHKTRVRVILWNVSTTSHTAAEDIVSRVVAYIITLIRVFIQHCLKLVHADGLQVRGALCFDLVLIDKSNEIDCVLKVRKGGTYTWESVLDRVRCKRLQKDKLRPQIINICFYYNVN